MSDKTNRTNLMDLEESEKELKAKELAEVQGGKVYNETRDNPTKTATGSITTLPAPVNPTAPIPASTTTTTTSTKTTQKNDFGD